MFEPDLPARQHDGALGYHRLALGVLQIAVTDFAPNRTCPDAPFPAIDPVDAPQLLVGVRRRITGGTFLLERDDLIVGLWFDLAAVDPARIRGSVPFRTTLARLRRYETHLLTIIHDVRAASHQEARDRARRHSYVMARSAPKLQDAVTMD